MSKNSPSGRDACIAAIAAHGKPMTANEIATSVVEAGVVPTLKGATPKATLSAQITSGAKKGETFRVVGSGRPQKFALRSGVEAAPDLVDALAGKVAEVTSRQAQPKTATVKATRRPKTATKSAEKAARPDPKPSQRHKATASANA